MSDEQKIKARLLDWAIVNYTEIYDTAENPQEVYTTLVEAGIYILTSC